MTKTLRLAGKQKACNIVRMSDEPRTIPSRWRIAWTAFFGVGCMLLVDLWLVSYWYHVSIRAWPAPRCLVGCQAFRGWLSWQVDVFRLGDPVLAAPHSRFIVLTPPSNLMPVILPEPKWNWRAQSRPTQRSLAITMPFRFLVPITIIFLCLPWLNAPKRFSLRTLLIAITLVGLLLGILAYMISAA